MSRRLPLICIDVQAEKVKIMKHIVASAALAVAIATASLAAATDFEITPREAGIVATAAEGVKPGANIGIVPPNFKPAPPVAAATPYVLVAAVTVGDKLVWAAKYSHAPFDTEAECQAFLESDDGLKANNAKLAEIAKAKINPEAKVAVSCEESQD